MKVTPEKVSIKEKIYMSTRTGTKATGQVWIDQCAYICDVMENGFSAEKYFLDKLESGYFVEVDE